MTAMPFRPAQVDNRSHLLNMLISNEMKTKFANNAQSMFADTDSSSQNSGSIINDNDDDEDEEVEETRDVVDHGTVGTTDCDIIAARENIRIDVINGGVAYEKNGHSSSTSNVKTFDVHQIDSHRLFEQKSNQLNQFYNQINNNHSNCSNGMPTHPNNTKNNNNQSSCENQNGLNVKNVSDRQQLNDVTCDVYRSVNGNGVAAVTTTTTTATSMNGSDKIPVNGTADVNTYNQIGLPASPPSIAPPLPMKKPLPPLPPPVPSSHSRKSYVITNGNPTVLTNGKATDVESNDTRKGKYGVLFDVFFYNCCV